MGEGVSGSSGGPPGLRGRLRMGGDGWSSSPSGFVGRSVVHLLLDISYRRNVASSFRSDISNQFFP